MASGDYSSMSRGTFKLLLKNTAKKFGWTEDDIFLMEKETGNKVLNPKIAGLIGFDNLDAMRKELTKDYIKKTPKKLKKKQPHMLKKTSLQKKCY